MRRESEIVDMRIDKRWHDGRLAYEKIPGITAIQTQWIPGVGYFLSARGSPRAIRRLRERVSK